MTNDSLNAPITFIVRGACDSQGRLHGVVERVRTGEKFRFHGAHEVGAIIERALAETSAGLQPAGTEQSGVSRGF